MSTSSGLVSFVGAGPGDPELITLRGLRRVREADVVIHDRLVARVLLDEVRSGAEVIDAGKAPGRHCMAQATIDRLLVDRARARRRVVRLKGGDPTVFGRLAEEIAAVRAAGIACEIVPGVTAATAAAAVAGVPLTARGFASTVVLATGTDHAGRRPAALGWDVIARTRGTLVFYMAVRALPSITTALTEVGREAREPALVVERAGALDARWVAGDLGDIAERARDAGIQSPAVLIVGPTVRGARTSGTAIDGFDDTEVATVWRT
jgi:uroporphyrin-III C-methyltransferase